MRSTSPLADLQACQPFTRLKRTEQNRRESEWKNERTNNGNIGCDIQGYKALVQRRATLACCFFCKHSEEMT
jgi:hypothetical protein